MTEEDPSLENTLRNDDAMSDKVIINSPGVGDGNSERTLDAQNNHISRKDTTDPKSVRSPINQEDRVFFSKVEDQEQIRERNNGATNSRSSSRNSYAINGDVVLRPPKPLENRILSAAVLAPPAGSTVPRKVHSAGDLRKLGSQRKVPSFKRKNQNMVLQLVLPANNLNNNYDNNYLSAKSIDDMLENGHLRDRSSRPVSFHSQNYVPNGSYVNRAYSPCDLSEYAQPIGSPGTFSVIHTPALSHEDKGTPPEEKKKAFVETLTLILSVMYGLFNISLGLAIYAHDMINNDYSSAEIFSLVTVVLALLYILYLVVDISLYMKQKDQYEKLLERNVPEEIEMKETEEGIFQFNITLPQAVTLKKTLGHHYCFSKDHHSANFYLKLGAAVFCFGHLIHSCLLLVYQIIFITSESFYECASIVQLAIDICYPLYSFLLLFFIFKFSNVIINRYTILAHFGVMHCLSSSICFWVWTICREILEELANKKYDTEYTTSSHLEEFTVSTSLNQKGPQFLSEYFQIAPRRFTTACENADQTLKTIYTDYSPYLYPFSVEFSILVVGILYLVWQNIAMCKAEDKDDEASTMECKNPSGNKDNMESNVSVHVDCQSSNRGIFGGFIVLVFTIVSTILFFIAIYTNEGVNGEIGVQVNIITSLVILVSMTIACLFGYHRITKLDVNKGHHSLLDDVLLFICIPAYFLNAIFSIIPAYIYGNVLGCITIIMEILQVLLQTSFIVDGERRSSNTKELRKKKPGREMVTFLVICNVALWIMQTFEVKSHGMQDNRYDFYGKELWTILGHMCLPLMMFYRFHASVCFGDIWKYAYEPSRH